MVSTAGATICHVRGSSHSNVGAILGSNGKVQVLIKPCVLHIAFTAHSGSKSVCLHEILRCLQD